jgi:rhamnosyltransferase
VQKPTIKVAAYTCSWNDKELVHRCLAAIRQQTYPVEKILVVDNRSSDGTPLEVFPDDVTLVCHMRNLGVGGGAASAIQFAIDCHCDWLWVLDQDSVPMQDALEQLIELFLSFPPAERGRIGLLSSTPQLDAENQYRLGHLLSPTGHHVVRIPEGTRFFEADANIWSGSMYNLNAVRQVGMPRFGAAGVWDDFNMDIGDLEFSWRIKRAGYRILVCPASTLVHKIGNLSTTVLWGRTFVTSNHSALRRYLSTRNWVYFRLYLNPDRKLLPVLLSLTWRIANEILHIGVLERNRRRKVRACIVGAWDGLRRRIGRNYSP